MPAKQNRKQRGQKNKRQKVSAPPLNPSPLSQGRMVTVAYAETRTLTEPVLGTAITYTYSMNGPFDPNTTGAGSQPVGFDPWMLMYQNFRVVRFHAEFTFLNNLATNCVVGLQPSAANALPSTIAAWLVDPKVQTVALGSVGGNSAVRVLALKGGVAPMLSVSNNTYRSDLDYAGSSIANPVRQLYGIAWARGIGTAASVDLVVRISYQMELFNPALQSLS